MRFAVAKQEGLTEDLVDAIDDDWSEQAVLSPRIKAALAFADSFLADEAGSVEHLSAPAGFDEAQRRELAVGLSLFHAFSKVIIAMGGEPAPGTMPTTELPTPTTDDPVEDYEHGFAGVDAALDQALAGERAALRHALQHRVAGAITGDGSSAGPTGGVDDAWLEVAERFALDPRGIGAALRERTTGAVGRDAALALHVAMAMADARTRLARSLVTRT